MSAAVLPERWRSDLLVLSDAPHYGVEDVDGDDESLLLVTAARRPGSTVVGRGDAHGVRGILEARLAAGRLERAGWMSVPRGTEPGPDVLGAMGLARFSSWDWLVTVEPPATVSGPPVLELDPERDAAAIRSCLAVANPSTSADPTAASEVAWFGVVGAGGLAGVVGAQLRGGPAGGGVSWHLHGLGVRPDARTAGVGTALAAAATRTAFAHGAAWVSLGMYADNDAARRVYDRLGFVTHARFDSYGPTGATSPPE